MQPTAMFGVDVEIIKTTAQIIATLVGLTTLATIALAISTFRRAKKVESAKWVADRIGQFYKFDKIDAATRSRFESDFFNYYAPSIEKHAVYPGRLTEEDNLRLAELDAMLNFFEMIAYLGQNDDFLLKSDREAAFAFWFDTIKRNKAHAALRLYLPMGFESLRKRVEYPDEQKILVAVYGSLMQGMESTLSEEAHREECRRARSGLRSLGPCAIEGQLYDLGEFPGLLRESHNRVTAELYEIQGNRLTVRRKLRELDAYEAHETSADQYDRRYIYLAQPPNLTAWVYFLKEKPVRAPLIRENSWSQYVQSRTEKADQTPR